MPISGKCNIFGRYIDIPGNLAMAAIRVRVGLGFGLGLDIPGNLAMAAQEFILDERELKSKPKRGNLTKRL